MSSSADVNVVIMAGGTGGHVFPALAVAAELKQQGVNLSWLGTKAGIEAELVPANAIPLRFLTIEGVRGKGIKSLLKAPFLLCAAIWQARKILRAESADVVLGMGGFASGPGGVAAKLLSIPVVIHEQNAVAGTTNKLLSKVATVCLEAFPGSLPKAIHVGNPVRKTIGSKEAIKGTESKLNVLVLGGSLGAKALNDLMPQVVAHMPETSRPNIRHQCGKVHADSAKTVYAQLHVEASVEPFIADMAEAYRWADFVVCRAGALTVSELTMAGKPALLIPYPYAIDDHQTKNAEWLVENNAALMCQQKDLCVEYMKSILNDMNNNRSKLKTMASNAAKLALPDAAKVVAQYCLDAANHSLVEIADEQ
jgi:UDP-N-acetylglucosamine--N-acetylmuramyl-(pentapeptide) pyrophosphoryl-undecaprenol N-acetylglucosamine transferase